MSEKSRDEAMDQFKRDIAEAFQEPDPLQPDPRVSVDGHLLYNEHGEKVDGLEVDVEVKINI